MFKTFLRQSREAKKKFINFSPFGRNSKSFEQLKDSFGRINISFEVCEREKERERESKKRQRDRRRGRERGGDL